MTRPWQAYAESMDEIHRASEDAQKKETANRCVWQLKHGAESVLEYASTFWLLNQRHIWWLMFLS